MLNELTYRLKQLESTVENLMSKFEYHESVDPDEDEEPIESKVSNTVLKPRTFEEVGELRKAVFRHYLDRHAHRVHELKKLSEIDDEISTTGHWNPPDDMQHASDIWTLYLDLLTQYCDDVEDLLQNQSSL